MGRHMCSSPQTHGKVLTPFKFSDSLTYLLCVDCKEVIAVWESDIKERNIVSEEKLKEWV
jgi:hypothetical protein